MTITWTGSLGRTRHRNCRCPSVLRGSLQDWPSVALSRRDLADDSPRWWPSRSCRFAAAPPSSGCPSTGRRRSSRASPCAWARFDSWTCSCSTYADRGMAICSWSKLDFLYLIIVSTVLFVALYTDCLWRSKCPVLLVYLWSRSNWTQSFPAILQNNHAKSRVDGQFVQTKEINNFSRAETSRMHQDLVISSGLPYDVARIFLLCYLYIVYTCQR